MTFSKFLGLLMFRLSVLAICALMTLTSCTTDLRGRGDAYDPVTAIMSSESLIEGSDIKLVVHKGLNGKKTFKVNSRSDYNFSQEDLERIREISRRFENPSKIARLLLDMSISKDEMEGHYFIEGVLGPRSAPFSISSEIVLYIGLDDESHWLRCKVRYYGSDWLFVRSWKVAADDFRWESPAHRFERDHASGSVWEWVDFSPTDSDLSMIKRLANAEKSTIRFNGKQYYRDEVIGYFQKADLNNMLALYELMQDSVK